jgi:hypothetical protein
MYRVHAVLLSLVIAMAPALGAPARFSGFASLEAIQKWIYEYRSKPDRARVPLAIRTLSQIGTLKDPESAGIYIGFLAGVIGSDQRKADELASKLFPMPPADQWVIVRAIAYSGLPDWQRLMTAFSAQMPDRSVMIDKYLAGDLPTLDKAKLESDKPGLMTQLKSYVTFEKTKKPNPHELTFASNPELLDTFWGYYFASGAQWPILRIVAVLPWSKDRDSVDKLNVGSMAKYTLSTYAMRDTALLRLLKQQVKHEPKEVAAVLNEVIEAADTADVGRVRKEALAAMDELKRKGPASKQEIALWGQVGEGAVSLGCVVAAAMSAAVLGIPCVVGGAATSAAVHYWASP